jgi:hypothetical protein
MTIATPPRPNFAAIGQAVGHTLRPRLPAHQTQTYTGRLGKTSAGPSQVADRPGYVWVRMDQFVGAPQQVWNPPGLGLGPILDMPVRVGYSHEHPNELQVLGVLYEAGASGQRGIDYRPPPTVQKRQIAEWHAHIYEALTIEVFPGHYSGGSYWPGGRIDLTDEVPVSGSAFAHVFFDVAAAELGVETGAAFEQSDAGGFPSLPDPTDHIPTLAAGLIPLVAVLLDAGDTEIAEADLWDTRPIVAARPGINLTDDAVGILPPDHGGTGVDNGTRTLTVATNGGTLAFAAPALTLTVPESGTAALLEAENVFAARQTIAVSGASDYPFLIESDEPSGGTGSAFGAIAYSDGQAPNVTVGRARGSKAAPTAVASGQRLMTWTTQGYDGSALTSSVLIRVNVDGTVSSGIVPGRFEIVTADATGALNEVMRATSTRTVLIGKTSGLSGAGDLDVAGNANADGNVTVSGRVGVGGVVTGTSINASQTFVGSVGVNGIRAVPTWQLSANFPGISTAVRASLILDQNGFNATSGFAGIGAQTTVTVSGASGTVTGATGANYQVVNTGGGVITRAYGAVFQNNANAGAGSITSSAGAAITNQSGATNNTNLLIGTTTIPTGNYSIYSSSTYDSYIAGALGIGIATPSVRLHVREDANSDVAVRIQNANTGASARAYFQMVGDAAGLVGYFGVASSGHSSLASTFFFASDSGATGGMLLRPAAGGVRIAASGASANDLVVTAGGLVALGHASPAARLDIAAGAMRFAEMTAPSAPAANSFLLFARDNGAGKTQACALFATGAIQVLATEP